MAKRILTGIKPTGTPHIGNYFGAIKPAIDLFKQGENEYFYFIADYHALNSLKTADEMQKYFYEVAAVWLACGLDPKKVVFYRQADIPEVFELNWILSNVTPKGLMNRAHAYKAAAEQNVENGFDADLNVNMGLYNYPILMAADILCFNTNIVPVGLDQKQHVEVARDIAGYFNKKYGKSLVVPDVQISKDFGTLPGLDGRKMSKSYNNVIALFAPEAELKKRIMSIKTDSSLPNEPKDKNSMVFVLYKLFASEKQVAEFSKKFDIGLSWAQAKSELFEVMNAYLAPMREKYNYYIENKKLIDEILLDGAKKARKIASETLNRVRQAIGVNKA